MTGAAFWAECSDKRLPAQQSCPVRTKLADVHPLDKGDLRLETMPAIEDGFPHKRKALQNSLGPSF